MSSSGRGRDPSSTDAAGAGQPLEGQVDDIGTAAKRHTRSGSLSELGFSAAQERTYRCLIGAEYDDWGTLAREARIAAGEARATVAGLVELGVLQTEAEQPLGVRVPRPTVAVGQLIERIEDDLMQRYRRVSAIRATLAELEAGYVHGAQRHQESGIERLDSLAAVRERLEELSFFTRSSAYAVQPGGPQSKASLDASRPLDERGLRRGIDMRVLHEATVMDDEINRSYLRELVAGGAKIRLTQEPISRMVIMDEAVAVVPIDPADSRRGALVVREPGLVSGMLTLFHRLWASAEELRGRDDVAEPEPELAIPEQDKRVLQQLASGATDETSAREIGVSVRHLRRTIARLMVELNASSRFEAGVEAVRRGWI